MDLDKTLAWKQSLVYLGGIILNILGWIFSGASFWFGLLFSIVGLGLIVYNVVSLMRSDQNKGVKIGLLVGKLIVFVLLLGASILVFAF
ncbi:hypothetical protein K9L67_03475 [Candidatus Woesearchaeota archaeon]|nr:hypothetical protein [Candidatus Woesearchaeota archaeon]MCF7901263.1 hypothetical protein [Candidatus Woesearchaeota archaeon]MCF8013570.1 hypothetical protein [Candidatus Woesearchaeota archaeon]